MRHETESTTAGRQRTERLGRHEWRGKLRGRRYPTSRTSVFVAWAALLGAFIHPAHGLGLDICYLRIVSHVPCPGCGLSRSLSCLVRGMVTDAWSYHPFGIVFLVLFVSIAVSSVMPSTRQPGGAAVSPMPVRWLGRAYAMFVGGFLTFGVLRALACWVP